MPTEDPVESLLDRWDSRLRADPQASADAFLLAEGSQLNEVQRSRFRTRAQALALINRGLNQAVAVSSGPMSGSISSKSDGSAPSEFAAGMEPVSGYVLQSYIGKGGFGQVWRATGPGGMPVALKIISSRAETLRTELESLESIKGVRHPHLLAVAAYWQQADRLFIASELADGTLFGRLQQVKEEGGAGIPVDELLQYMTEAAEAIDFLNSPQSTRPAMQHGDIKPQNLLLMSGSVKVGDFGLIQPLSGVEIDHHGMMTVQYASPEFLDGRLSAASDQFSLAVTYCCLRTGRLPFGGTLLEYRESIRNGRADLSGLTSAESAIVRRAIAVTPTDRFTSCCAFVSELKNALRNSRAKSIAIDYPIWGGHPVFTVVQASAGGLAVVLVVVTVLALIVGTRVPVSPPLPAIAPFDPTQARKHQEAWAKHLGIEVETTNSIGQTLVVIPPGQFTMGEEDKTVDVMLTRPFLFGRTEVTQGQWTAVMGTEPWKGQKYATEGTDVAATLVSWHDAVAFCAELTARERVSGKISRGQAYRLPTEAEWEYACQAGSIPHWSFGDEILLLEYAWFDANSGAKTHPVGKKKPNAWGLFDMHGNVFEWCNDGYGEVPKGATTDPQGPSDASGRVYRGGGSMSSARYCRSAGRYGLDPSSRYFLGFRVALSLPDAEPPAAPAK